MHHMVQKRTRAAGRPPNYDREAVIAKAMVAFWSDGYEATTLSDLERATGLDRSSIYNSFGGKSGLHELAVETYLTQGRGQLFAPLTHGTEGIADLVEFLNRMQTMQDDDSTPSGCLVINDLCFPGNEKPSDTYLEILGTGLADAIARANGVDHTDPALNEARHATLMASIVGINLLHHRDSSASAMIDGLRDLVSSWA